MPQQMQAALYFEGVEGFGEWEILLGSRPAKYLREARKHGRTFDIILKKLRSVTLSSRGSQSHANCQGTFSWPFL